MYAQVINSFVSTEGSNGIMTNYIYYTVLVVHDDGSRSVFNTKDISSYASIIRTPMDEIAELRETVRSLREDMNSIIQQKVDYVVDSLYPIPDTRGMVETDAVKALTDAGLTPSMKWTYPEGTPAIGIVGEYVRSTTNFKVVQLDVRHTVPDVEGMNVTEASEVLKQAGYRVHVDEVMKTDAVDGQVFSCTPTGKHTDMTVNLKVVEAVPVVVGLLEKEAVAALEKAGKAVAIVKQYDNARYGEVLFWHQDAKNPHTVEIGVCAGAACMKSIHVETNWTTLSDSSGDKYQANAELNRDTKQLTIYLKAQTSAKAKRSIAYVGKAVLNKEKAEIGSDEVAIEIKGAKTMDAKSPAEFEICIPWRGTAEDTLEKAVVVIHTSYGLIKKEEEDIRLTFAFTW